MHALGRGDSQMKWNASNPTVVHGAGAAAVLTLTVLLYSMLIQPMWHEQGERSALQNSLADQRLDIERQERLRRGTTLQLAQVLEAAEQSSMKLKDAGALNEQLAKLSDAAARCGL